MHYVSRKSCFLSLSNEKPTQIELFPIVLIASTNLMDGLDQAALRRFELKVKFNYLRPYQAWELLCCHCTELGPTSPPTELNARLAYLSQLTPGDFAAVLRQNRFRPITSAVALVCVLEAE